MARKILKDDEVIIISGRDKGRRGRIVRVRSDDRVIVSGLNLVKKHVKPNPNIGQAGGRLEREAPIHISNVALYNPAKEGADKVKFQTREDGNKVRVFKSDGLEVASAK